MPTLLNPFVQFVIVGGGPPPGGALFTADWSAANGSDWPASQWEAISENGGTLEVMDGFGRFTSTGAAYNGFAADFKASLALPDDFDIIFPIKWTNIAAPNEFQFHFSFRGSWDFGDSVRFHLQSHVGDTLIGRFAQHVGYAETTLDSETGIPEPIEGRTWNIRVQANGTALKAKWWDTIGAEPGTWNLETTSSAGDVMNRMQIELQNDDDSANVVIFDIGVITMDVP